MRTPKRLLAIVIAVVLIGGGWLLATRDFPAPAERVVKPISDDRLPR